MKSYRTFSALLMTLAHDITKKLNSIHDYPARDTPSIRIRRPVFRFKSGRQVEQKVVPEQTLVLFPAVRQYA